jgi:hypothetical protein
MSLSTTNTYRRQGLFSRIAPARCDLSHSSGSRRNEHVIVMRRLKPGTQLPGYPPRVEDPVAGDTEGGRVVVTVHIEMAGQFVLHALDLQSAARPPAGRRPGQRFGPEISGKAAASSKVGPVSWRSSTRCSVLISLALAASCAVESSIRSAMRTLPVRGRRPCTGRPATRAANSACDWAGSTRQLPAAGRGGMPGLR